MIAVLAHIARLAKLCISGPGGRLGVVYFVAIVVLGLIGVRVAIQLITWNADFYNAVQKLDVPAALHQIWVFFGLTAITAALHLASTYLRRQLQIRWRHSLTEAALDVWLKGKAYWHLRDRAENGLDNPDQRIAEDCNMFPEFILGKDDMRAGVLDFIMSLVGLVSYVMLLWQLSDFALQFSLFGHDFEIPHYMMWAAPIYVALATLLTHLLGRKLSGLLMQEQRREADFRFSLVHLRENAAAVALSGGEAAERRLLTSRFDDVVTIWHQVIRREFIFGLFSRPYFASVLRIPTFLALPVFLAGKIPLGGLMQLAQAFTNVVTTLSWLIFNYKFLSDLVATTRRLQGFLDAMDGIDPAHALRRTPSPDDGLHLQNVVLRAPGGRVLLDIPALSVARGETVWLNGASGLGKSTLFKAMAGLWPHAEGQVALPPGDLCFMPQQVYLPLGDLVSAAVYPANSHSMKRDEVEDLLRHVGLGARLDAGDDTSGGLSVGEQQRLALVRLMVSRPDWIFLDEATSALDLETERTMMELLRAKLPEATLIIVAHREPQGLDAIRRVELSCRETATVVPDEAAVSA